MGVTVALGVAVALSLRQAHQLGPPRAPGRIYDVAGQVETQLALKCLANTSARIVFPRVCFGVKSHQARSKQKLLAG
jgi:hypothetical protein